MKLSLLLICLATATAQLVSQPGVFFTATTTPNSGSGVTQTGGVTYVNVDGTYRVINSTDGVPTSLRPSQVAMSSILLNAVDGQVQLSTSSSAVSTYVTLYSTFLNTGGVFNQTGSVSGSNLSAVASTANTSFQLAPSEKYVLVLGNVSNPTNATYKLRTTGTKTLPSGQVVTATLVPGNLAFLGHFDTTGSAQIDIQVQQQSANANGIVDFFLVDQQQAIQLQSSDYVARTTQAAASNPTTSGGGQSFSLNNGGSPPAPPTSPGSSTSNGGSQPTPTPAPGSSSSNFGPSSPLATTLPPVAYATSAVPNSPQATTISMPPPSTSNFANFTGIPQSAQTTDTNQEFFSNTPTNIDLNSGIKLSVGTRISVLTRLQDYVGQLFLIAYYEPSSSNGAVSGSGIRYAPPTANDPQVLVSAAIRLSSTTFETAQNPPAIISTPFTSPPALQQSSTPTATGTPASSLQSLSPPVPTSPASAQSPPTPDPSPISSLPPPPPTVTPMPQLYPPPTPPPTVTPMPQLFPPPPPPPTVTPMPQLFPPPPPPAVTPMPQLFPPPPPDPCARCTTMTCNYGNYTSPPTCCFNPEGATNPTRCTCCSCDTISCGYR